MGAKGAGYSYFKGGVVPVGREVLNRRVRWTGYGPCFRLRTRIAITEITAAKGPPTNAPVIAASMDLSWVLEEKSSIAAIVPNKPTTYPRIAASSATPTV